MTHDRTHFRRIPALLLLFALLLPAAVPRPGCRARGTRRPQPGGSGLSPRPGRAFPRPPTPTGPTGTWATAPSVRPGPMPKASLKRRPTGCCGRRPPSARRRWRTFWRSTAGRWARASSTPWSASPTAWAPAGCPAAPIWRSCWAGPGDTYDTLETVNAFGVWCHAGGQVVKGLARRRMEEAALFLWGDYSGQAAGSFTYLVFDPGEGEMASDVMFYQAGQPYGAFPDARREGYALEGWRRPEGALCWPACPRGRAGRWRPCGGSSARREPLPRPGCRAWYYD